MNRHQREDTGAVIAAAGRSERTGDIDKLWAPLAGADGRPRPLLAYAVAPFQESVAVGFEFPEALLISLKT